VGGASGTDAPGRAGLLAFGGLGGKDVGLVGTQPPTDGKDPAEGVVPGALGELEFVLPEFTPAEVEAAAVPAAMPGRGAFVVPGVGVVVSPGMGAFVVPAPGDMVTPGMGALVVWGAGMAVTGVPIAAGFAVPDCASELGTVEAPAAVFVVPANGAVHGAPVTFGFCAATPVVWLAVPGCPAFAFAGGGVELLRCPVRGRGAGGVEAVD